MGTVMEVYVDYLDSKNGYRPARKDFETWDLAWAWIKETFDKPSVDFIKFY
jgi:hypothetical protein